MKEEIRRIEEVKRLRANAAASRTTNLTGEQLFIRSCNTCHPGGGKGPMAGSLIDMDQHYPKDEQLKAFLRKGKGIMPPLPVATVNDEEMTNLMGYLRQLNEELHEADNERKARERRRAAAAARK